MTRWLTAGVIENRHYAPTTQGTPQGGVISPLLRNIALHGMESAAGVRYKPWRSTPYWSTPGSPVLIRCADDLVALCHSREEAEQVKERLCQWTVRDPHRRTDQLTHWRTSKLPSGQRFSPVRVSSVQRHRCRW